MNKTSPNLTSLLLGVIAAALLLIALRPAALPANQGATGRYQIQRVNDSNVFVLDTQTGLCWRKFVESNGGPSQWQVTYPIASDDTDVKDGPDAAKEINALNAARMGKPFSPSLPVIK